MSPGAGEAGASSLASCQRHRNRALTVGRYFLGGRAAGRARLYADRPTQVLPAHASQTRAASGRCRLGCSRGSLRLPFPCLPACQPPPDVVVRGFPPGSKGGGTGSTGAGGHGGWEPPLAATPTPRHRRRTCRRHSTVATRARRGAPRKAPPPSPSRYPRCFPGQPTRGPQVVENRGKPRQDRPRSAKLLPDSTDRTFALP